MIRKFFKRIRIQRQKRKHLIPVYRRDVLEYAIKTPWNKRKGVCGLLKSSLQYYGFRNEHITTQVFPLHDIDNADEFRSASDNFCGLYWWPRGDFRKNSGRMKYLLWLYEQYRDNDEDLRTMNFKIEQYE